MLRAQDVIDVAIHLAEKVNRPDGVRVSMMEVRGLFGGEALREGGAINRRIACQTRVPRDR